MKPAAGPALGRANRVDGEPIRGGLVRRWFLRPEPGAAGTMGLYRVLFAAGYLWYRALIPASMLVGATDDGSDFLATRVLRKLHVPDPSPDFLSWVLVGSLVALLLGWRTRWATAAVLVSGCWLELGFATLSQERSHVFLVFFVPLFFLIGGDWGSTWSLDALRRPAPERVDPDDGDGRFLVPMRGVLVVLSLLFAHAVLVKTTGRGNWLEEPGLMAEVVTRKVVKREVYGYAAIPLAAWFVTHPAVHQPARFGVLLFETSFPLALASAGLRRFMSWAALAFHGVNALALLVTFTPMLFVYPAFLRLQAVAAVAAGRGCPTRSRRRSAVNCFATAAADASAARFHAAVAAALLIFVVAWHVTPLPRAVTLDGKLDWHTIWWVATPVALAMTGVHGWRLLLMGAAAAGSRRAVRA